MQHIESSIVMEVRPERAYEYVRDPATQSQWITSLTEVFDITGPAPGKQWKWRYRMVGIPLEGHSHNVGDEPGERIVTRTEGGVGSTWDFSFSAEGEGTRVMLKIDYEIPIPVLGRLAEKLIVRRNQREMDSNLENIKDILEGE